MPHAIDPVTCTFRHRMSARTGLDRNTTRMKITVISGMLKCQVIEHRIPVEMSEFFRIYEVQLSEF